MDITPLQQWMPDLQHPLVIAGPCSAESEDQVMDIACQLAKIEHVKLFRAGIWKPRTRPNQFEGLGEISLPWLKRVKDETGLMTATEVANARHLELAMKYDIDVIWLGARTTVNPFSVQEIANALKGTDLPVMVKNPVNADLALWIGALERLGNAGVSKLIAVHRGFSSFEKTAYRNPPMWKIPLELNRIFPQLPIICDPSHIGGNHQSIYQIAQKAMDVGMDGLMIEVHNNPEQALSDAEQQIKPEMLKRILGDLKYRSPSVPDNGFSIALQELRSQIDRVDNELIEALQMRMQIVDKIGRLKIENNVTAFQVKRMDKMLNKRMLQAQEIGLRPEYIKEIYHIIHEESVKKQTDMMRDKEISI